MHGHHEFDLYEAIYTTRSMRRLKSDPVPPNLIVKVIEAATIFLVHGRVTRALLAVAMLMDLIPLGMFALHMLRATRY